MPKPKESKEHYDTEYWERMADIEHQMVDGISLKDRIDKEVDLVLDHADLNLKPGDKVLDLASGTGPHAIQLAKRTGADVQGRDVAQTLVDIANQEVQDETREKILNVNFELGNYSDVKDSIEPGQKFKCITIFGSSFIYLKSHEEYQKALQDFYDILEPGGKLVIQWREKNQYFSAENRKLSSDEEVNKRGYQWVPLEEGKKDTFSRTAHGPMCWKKPTDTEEGYGMYVTEGEQGSNQHPYQDIPGPEGDLDYFSFGRVYVDNNRHELPVPSTSGLSFLDTSKLPLMERMITEAGFLSPKLIPGKEGVDLSKDGYRRLFAIVAEKPVN